MLVLSRKVDQRIMIGDSIAITIVAVSRNKVRLGIDAPKNVTVHRREIYEAIQREQEASHPEEVEDHNLPAQA